MRMTMRMNNKKMMVSSRMTTVMKLPMLLLLLIFLFGVGEQVFVSGLENTSTTSTSKTKTAGWALECDGVDDWATLPIRQLPEEGSWTLEAWLHVPKINIGSIFTVTADESDSDLLQMLTSFDTVPETGETIVAPSLFAMNLEFDRNVPRTKEIIVGSGTEEGTGTQFSSGGTTTTIKHSGKDIFNNDNDGNENNEEGEEEISKPHFHHIAIVIQEEPVEQQQDAVTVSVTAYWDGEPWQFASSLAIKNNNNDQQSRQGADGGDVLLSSSLGAATIRLCHWNKIQSFSTQRERFGAVVLDDIRFWGKARTLEEIRETMYADLNTAIDTGGNANGSDNTTLDTDSLLHWWNMDQGVPGNVIFDSIQRSHGSLASRREYTNQKPKWVPSLAPLKQAPFVAVSGVTGQTIQLPSSSPDSNQVYRSDTPTKVQVESTSDDDIVFDIFVREKPRPIAGNNKCLVLNGFDAYGLADDNFDLPPSFSIDMWIHAFSVPPTGWTDFSSKHSSVAENLFLWEISLKRNDDTGELQPTMYIRLGEARSYVGKFHFEPHHLAMTSKADLATNTSLLTLYVNGEEVFQKTMDDYWRLNDPTNLPWTMGQDFDNRGGVVPSDFFHGTIDELRFWKRDLTQGEVQKSMTTAIDHGPDYPYLLKSYSYDDRTVDDAYTLYGRSKLLPCQASGFQARPLALDVQVGSNISFELPYFDPEDAAVRFELIDVSAALENDDIDLSDENAGLVMFSAAEENRDRTVSLTYKVIDEYGQEAIHPGLVEIQVLRNAPEISSLVAIPNKGYGSGSEIHIVWSEPTNMANLTDNDILFAPPIAESISLNWRDPSTLVATILVPVGLGVETKTANSFVGAATVTIAGDIRGQDEKTVTVNSTSPPLEGSWGEGGSSSALSAGAMAGIIAAVIVIIVIVYFYVTAHLLRATGFAPKPSATPKPICILFTDIESSTKLWSQNPEWMSRALEIHHSEIRKSIRENRGYEVKTIGDAFMCAVSEPINAMKLGLDIQNRLHSHFAKEKRVSMKKLVKEGKELPTLKVRIGIHYGICDITFDPISKGYDYYGTPVNTASRVEDSGHGGQIVVTESLFEAVKDKLDDLGAIYKDLGLNELRGVTGDVRLYQVLPQRCKGMEFPPLRLEKKAKPELQKSLVRESAKLEEDVENTPATDQEGLSWLEEKIAHLSLVRGGRLDKDSLYDFLYPLVEVLVLLFSITGTKPALDLLIERWRIHTISDSHDDKVQSLAFKLGTIVRHRMEEQGKGFSQLRSVGPEEFHQEFNQAFQ